MHNNFSEWYRLVSLEPDGTKLAKRWAGVKTWTTELRKNNDHVLETVRIYQGLPPRASREPFLAVFRRHDPSFPQRNDHELRVLAGAALVNCVQSVGEDGEGLHAAILAGAALEASSLRLTDPRLEEISREVATGLQALAVAQRERRPFDASAITSKADAAEDALVQVSQTPGNNADALKNALVPVLWVEVASRLRRDLPLEPIGIGRHSARHTENRSDRGDEILPPRASVSGAHRHSTGRAPVGDVGGAVPHGEGFARGRRTAHLSEARGHHRCAC